MLKITDMNKHAIHLIKEKQLLYGLIYTLSLVEVETLKAFIETHLKIRYFQLFKSPIGAFIFFDKKTW